MKEGLKELLEKWLFKYENQFQYMLLKSTQIHLNINKCY